MNQLSYLSVLRLTGGDAIRFLHNQLSADISALQHGESTFACLCQPKGRVIALLLVQTTENGALVVCAQSLAEMVARRLAMFVLRDDVRIETDTSLSVLGDSEEVTLEPLPGMRYAVGSPDAETGDDSETAWKRQELRQGIAWLDAESSEKFLPQMLGYEAIGALSFRKGCYPGQEIIARTRYLGTLKQRVLQVETDSAVAPPNMSKVTLRSESDEASAIVVDSASDNSGTVMLLVARAPEEFNPSSMASDELELAIQTSATT